MSEYKMRKRRKGCFFMMSKEPLRCKGLSLKAKGFLAMMMTLPPDWDFSVKGIIACLKESECAVRSTIDELISSGYCKMTRQYENGKIKKWLYTFTDEQGKFDDEVDELLPENLLVENLLVENPKVDINKEYNKDNKEINKENNKEKDTLDSVSKKLSHKYNKDVPLTDKEIEFYVGMEKTYPHVMRMDAPLLYSQYKKLLTEYKPVKIKANLEAMENYKPLKNRRDAYRTLRNWLELDKREYQNV